MRTNIVDDFGTEMDLFHADFPTQQWLRADDAEFCIMIDEIVLAQ